MAEEQAVAEEGKNPGKRMMVLVMIIVLLTAILGGGAAWYFLSESAADAGPEPAQQAKKKVAIYVSIRTLSGKPSIITNFSERSGRQRFLQVFVEARTRDTRDADALKKHMPAVVQALSAMYSNQPFATLQTHEGRVALQVDSVRLIQEILQKETGRLGVEEVFFTNFVMQ